MIDWIRPSGTNITTNDSIETVKYCESLGWEIVKAKRKRRTKEEMANDNSSSSSESNRAGDIGTGV